MLLEEAQDLKHSGPEEALLEHLMHNSCNNKHLQYWHHQTTCLWLDNEKSKMYFWLRKKSHEKYFTHGYFNFIKLSTFTHVLLHFLFTPLSIGNFSSPGARERLSKKKNNGWQTGTGGKKSEKTTFIIQPKRAEILVSISH